MGHIELESKMLCSGITKMATKVVKVGGNRLLLAHSSNLSHSLLYSLLLLNPFNGFFSRTTW